MDSVALAAGSGRASDEALALAVLDAAGVLIHPGSLFELEPAPCGASLVANLLAPEDEFAAGSAALARFLADWAAAESR